MNWHTPRHAPNCGNAPDDWAAKQYLAAVVARASSDLEADDVGSAGACQEQKLGRRDAHEHAQYG